MLRTRVLASLVLLPIVVAAVVLGGAAYSVGVTVLLGIGVWELNRMMRAEGYAPSLPVSWLLLLVIVLAVTWPSVLGPGFAGTIILALTVSLYRFHRGDTRPLNSFTLMLGVPLYIGWLGTHLLMLRALPAGEWWTLVLLTSTFATDSGAYLVGTWFGRHKLDPKVSPRKTWEGYAGGVASGVLLGAAAALLLGSTLAPSIQPWHGAVLGLLVAVVTPLGDLGVSAFKRQAGVKDSSRLIPGHGGVMDRLDTVLVAAVLGYYFVLWLA
jgi:phosphatidate cytidylyltransferase